VLTQHKDPATAIRDMTYPMGDKGKKDKNKARKQKIIKQEQSARKTQEEIPQKFPARKA